MPAPVENLQEQTSSFLTESIIAGIVTGRLAGVLISFLIYMYFLFVFSMAAPTAYGGSQARVPTRAVAAGLHHSHSTSGSEPCQQPTPQLMATSDP